MARSRRKGIRPQDMIGRKCYQTLFDRSSPCAGCLVSVSLQNNKKTQRKLLEEGTGNGYLEWVIETYPITNEEEQVVQAILFEQDVTESRRLEAILAQSEKLAAIGQLSAGLAHDRSTDQSTRT